MLYGNKIKFSQNRIQILSCSSQPFLPPELTGMVSSISTDHLLCFKVGVFFFFFKGANLVVQYHQEEPLVNYI